MQELVKVIVMTGIFIYIFFSRILWNLSMLEKIVFTWDQNCYFSNYLNYIFSHASDSLMLYGNIFLSVF